MFPRFALGRFVFASSFALWCLAPLAVVNAAPAKSISAGAAVAISFDDPARPDAVLVKGIPEPFSAKLVNAPRVVPSPFWNQHGRSALRLDAAKKQSVQL